MTTTLILLEKTQRDKYNVIKKVTNVDWSESVQKRQMTHLSLDGVC